MRNATRIRLLDAEPDLARHLTEEERDEAAALTVPVVRVGPGALDIDGLLGSRAAFGALVLDGMLLRHLRVGEQTGLRLLGPGDLLSLSSAPASTLLVESGLRATAPTRLALLANDVLLAAHHWPRLVAGLQTRAAEQVDRVAVQLAICQLPRVEHRLLALLWLLAESWGHVTPLGTTLPLSLTHETLAGLIGARRPTVTLALGELTERGAVVRQDAGWLLVEPPPAPSGGPVDVRVPRIVESRPSLWGSREEPQSDRGPAFAELAATIARLRVEHIETAGQMRDGMARVAAARQRSGRLRERIRESRALRSRQAP
jgi:CRP/FNR family transcriptional regulator, cyclic AMP receptor protein